ncbi:MAG: acyltransferase family protein [Vicinamibacterales bacterium]|nr:acyltransferase family protein [Vicinamibacterales bacterium]MDP6609722.1 acyltransferase family protein [Vicinamibacterales bacterium]HAK57223.1 hypothetical protein [Acidobacteriota bacterium]|tara:strand:- start:8303 stop:9547 length:1245 start_codon:yes stop_codon:yes gene_type:complete
MADSRPLKAGRIYYMDALRALAMLLGVFFHAALAYAALFQGLWLVGDMRASSMSLEVFAWFSHLFRMTLFFLIAGFFAHLLVERRGVKGFLRNRAIRIVLPFVIFWSLATAAIFFAIVWALDYIQELPPILQLVTEAVERGDDPPPATTGHLWFLYNLTFLCAIAAVLSRVRWQWVTRAATGFFASTRHLLWAPLLLVPALYSTSIPVPSPESFTPQLFSFGYYGLFFLMGWHFLRHQGYLDLIDRRLGVLAGASVVGYVVYFFRLPIEAFSVEVLRTYAKGPPELTGWTKLLDAALEAYLSTYLTLVMLALGRRLLDSRNRALRYISDAPYWIYLVHLPLLFYIQVALTRLDLNVWLKFAISSLGTIAIALAAYELGIRYTPIWRDQPLGLGTARRQGISPYGIGGTLPRSLA